MAKVEQPDWTALNQLLNNNDLAGFWATYANYLQHTGMYSTARIVIHRAASLTVTALNVQEQERQNGLW